MPGVDGNIVAPRVDLGSDANVALSGAAVDAFVAALGGRHVLVETLLIGTGDPAIDRVVALLDDPVYAGLPLQKLCAHAGLSLADFLVAYQHAMLKRGEIASTRVITQRMVEVVDDVMRRAAPYEEACSCLDADRPTCRTCRGTGVRKIYPELDRQKVALELAKLLTKGGPLIQNTQNTLVAGSGPTMVAAGSLADLSAAVADVLKPRRALAPAPSPADAHEAPCLDVP